MDKPCTCEENFDTDTDSESTSGLSKYLDRLPLSPAETPEPPANADCWLGYVLDEAIDADSVDHFDVYCARQELIRLRNFSAIQTAEVEMLRTVVGALLQRDNATAISALDAFDGLCEDLNNIGFFGGDIYENTKENEEDTVEDCGCCLSE